jgi:CheY-like chemotaxis protein
MRPTRPLLLVVDDDRLLRWAIRRALKDQVRVRAAGSGEEAMKLVRRGTRIDGALVDVKLPGMSGVEFARQVRELRPDLKIFLMTAYDRATAPKEAFSVKAEGYLPKPFEMSLLRDMMASHL